MPQLINKKEELTPAQKAASDAVYDNVYDDADKHIKSGGSAEQIEEHFGLKKASSATPDEQGAALGLLQSMIGVQGPQQPAQAPQAGGMQMAAPQTQQAAGEIDPNLASIISLIQGLSGQGSQPSGGQVLPATSMFSGGGVDSNNNVTQPGMLRQIAGSLVPMLGPGSTVTENLQQAKLMQEMQGGQPLQAGERQKTAMTSAVDIYKETLKLQQEGNLKPNEIFTKFEAASQPFIVARNAYSQMQDSHTQAMAGDAGAQMAGIYQYMKMQSPESAVMPGEFANAENMPGVSNFVLKHYNQTRTGNRLAPNIMKSYYDQAGRTFKSLENQQKKTTEQFSLLAKNNNLIPKKVIRDTGMNEEKGEQSTSNQVGKYSFS